MIVGFCLLWVSSIYGNPIVNLSPDSYYGSTVSSAIQHTEGGCREGLQWVCDPLPNLIGGFAFGILASRFGVLLDTMEQRPKVV